WDGHSQNRATDRFRTRDRSGPLYGFSGSRPSADPGPRSPDVRIVIVSVLPGGGLSGLRPAAGTTSRPKGDRPSLLSGWNRPPYTRRMCSSQAFRAAFGLLFASALAVAAPVEAGKPKAEAPPPKPKLKLLAEPAVGFTPVSALLTAKLTGVTPDDFNFCHPAVTWIRIPPGQTEDQATHIHEDPVCRHPESKNKATTSFIK